MPTLAMANSRKTERTFSTILAITAAGVMLSASVSGRGKEYPKREPVQASAAQPAYCLAKHDIGQLVFGVSNNGTVGLPWSASGEQDCFTGESMPRGEYPKGSGSMYFWGFTLWIGAVVGRDTLVSTGALWFEWQMEFHPDEPPLGNMIRRSIIDPMRPEYEGAISEQDYIAVYTDTFTAGVQGLGIDFLDGRPHVPLGIEVTQRSFAWSYSYAEDFVLFDLAIKNIGRQRLSKVYLGMYVECDVCMEVLHGPATYSDDICGFLDRVEAGYLPAACPDEETVNLAWVADNDGDMSLTPEFWVPHVTGTRVVRTPADSLEVSFNWWIWEPNFGPQTREKFRELGTGGSGIPYGDRNKYHFLSNGEFDYDQIYTASISDLDPVWLPPDQMVAADVADGYDVAYVLSCGPFGIDPGQSLPLSFAYVAGGNLHTDAGNAANLPHDPDTFNKNLDFTDFAQNAVWAEWIYDNPGVDTDGDGYAGVFYPCTLSGGSEPVVEQIARRGDGVPDFRGASPPPAPRMWIEPQVGVIHVRWNGFHSETTVDNFTGNIDFEGYRVYLGRDDRRSSMSVIQSYDRDNYQKWVWDDSVQVEGRLGGYVISERPFTLEELRCLYAPNGCYDSLWHPLDYPRSNFFVFQSTGRDSLFYFEPQDFNRSVLANYLNATTQIRKRDLSAIEPTAEWIEDTSLIPDSLHDRVLTDDGYFLYYEYEYTIENLLPTVPYWINVTAFDYGSPHLGLASLETSPTVRPAISYAHESVQSVMLQDELQVYVYPNPYRADGRYRQAGYEGLGLDERTRPDDRVRRIHFANLPPRCTIRIFSLDGDLVRELEHDVDPDDPLANHGTWDLISRNAQLIVSGLYYWVVETPDGRTQVGKIVVLL
ncbi:MAG: hypothetical protein JSU65_02850 [Candidatus Zixiibacteriota bacterium]|nr:MAG: hypothetical protein JSU65_02850 [candidate division Zixibacteria bacterium]